MAKTKYQTEEQKELIKFLIILGVVVVLIVGVYFLSKAFTKEEAKEYEYQAGVVGTSQVIVGTMLSRKDTEYYVLAYDSSSDYANSYSIYASYYTNEQKNALKVYYLDLSSAMNKNYYVTEGSNPKATKMSELKMKDGTLIRVKNGKITKYVEGIENISKELKVTEKKESNVDLES